MRPIIVFVTLSLVAFRVQAVSVEDFYPLQNGDGRNYIEEGGTATYTEQVSSSSRYGGQFKISTRASDYPGQRIDNLVGFFDGDLYCYGIDQFAEVNEWMSDNEGGSVYVYSFDVELDYSNPVKILESDYLSGEGGSFSDSFSGTATLTFNTREWGTQTLMFPLTGSVSGAMEPTGTVEAMSGFFFNCRELSFEMSVTIDPYGDSTEMNFRSCSYLAPEVGSVRDKLYEDDEDGGLTYQYDTVLTSGRANGQTVRSVDVYTLAVNNGSGDGTMYTNSKPVAVSADSAPSGKMFDHWTVSPSQYAVNLVNEDSASTTFVMPGANVTLTATYKDLPRIAVSAGEGGSVSPDTEQMVSFGASLILTATPASGYKLKHWLMNGEIISAGQKEISIENITADMTVDIVFQKVSAMPWLNLLLE